MSQAAAVRLKDSPRPQAGGGLPRTVIRGELTNQVLVSVDYLNVSFPGGKVAEFVGELVALVGAGGAEDRDRGIHGYERSFDVGGFGIVGYGGAAQRGTILVSINGAGCQRVADFRPFVEWCTRRGGRITRLDIAADDHEGKSFSCERALAGWNAGLFQRQSVKPNAQHVSDCGSNKGSTVYVGARKSGKLCRIYEKGKQLGDAASAWVRAEVEFLAKDRVIPWEAVLEPVRYLAGSYRYFERMALVPAGIRTFKRSAAITLEALTAWCKSAAGRTVNALLEHTGGDIGGVVMLIRREGLPARLIPFHKAPCLAGAS